jgi:predicted small secreted protein
MNKSYFIFFLILVIPFVLGACNTGQIDINSASKKELEKIYGIGEVKSQAIIDRDHLIQLTI